jgi:hypothetical protein
VAFAVMDVRRGTADGARWNGACGFYDTKGAEQKQHRNSRKCPLLLNVRIIHIPASRVVQETLQCLTGLIKSLSTAMTFFFCKFQFCLTLLMINKDCGAFLSSLFISSILSPFCPFRFFFLSSFFLSFYWSMNFTELIVINKRSKSQPFS